MTMLSVDLIRSRFVVLEILSKYANKIVSLKLPWFGDTTNTTAERRIVQFCSGFWWPQGYVDGGPGEFYQNKILIYSDALNF